MPNTYNEMKRLNAKARPTHTGGAGALVILLALVILACIAVVLV